MVREYFAQRFQHWVAQRHPSSLGPWQLHSRRLYILPTGFGYVFALLLFILFLWSINYNNNLGFMLVFLLIAVVLNAMRRTHSNLLDLQLRMLGVEPVFAGQAAQFRIWLEHTTQRPRYGIELSAGGDSSLVNLPQPGGTHVLIARPTTTRGWLECGHIKLWTTFPLGLFRAWTWVNSSQRCLVYPAPRGGLPLPPTQALDSSDQGDEQGEGSDDFAGLRAYQVGDSPRHVAWKASAHGDDLLVKRFSSQAQPRLWLDWQMLGHEPLELRLSQLCQWILKAEELGLDYGLRLPGKVFAPAHGDAQRRRCLEALALYEGN